MTPRRPRGAARSAARAGRAGMSAVVPWYVAMARAISDGKKYWPITPAKSTTTAIATIAYIRSRARFGRRFAQNAKPATTTGRAMGIRIPAPKASISDVFSSGNCCPVMASRADSATPWNLWGSGSPRSSTGTLVKNSTETAETSARPSPATTARSPGRRLPLPPSRPPKPARPALAPAPVREPSPAEPALEPRDEAGAVVLGTAFVRRAASASRDARLRAARRCLEVWRLSGTADNGTPRNALGAIRWPRTKASGPRGAADRSGGPRGAGRSWALAYVLVRAGEGMLDGLAGSLGLDDLLVELPDGQWWVGQLDFKRT